MRLGRRTTDALVGLLVAGLIFGGFEVYLRWTAAAQRVEIGRHLLAESREHQAQGVTADPSLLDAWEMPDPVLGYRPRPGFSLNGVQLVNSLGYRGPEFSPVKRPGTFRIVALGDSATFGMLSIAGCSWPAQLQVKLDARAPGRYEVINGGVEGYAAWHVLQRLRNEVVQFQPDMIITLVGWNDLWAYDPADQKQAQNPMAVQELKNSWYNRVVLRSYAMKRLTKWALESRVLLQAGRTPAGALERARAFVPEASARSFREIVAVARAGGIRYVVLGTQPSVAGSDRLDRYRHVMHFPSFAQTPELFIALWDRYSQVIRTVARDEDAILIDMAEVFRKEIPDSGQYFVDSVHPSCRGYELLGGKVTEQLAGAGALPAR